MKSDAEGFLVGDPVSVDRGSADRALAIWKQIQSDVGEIKDAIAGSLAKEMRKAAGRASSPATPNRGGDGGVSRVRLRGPDGRFAVSVATPQSGGQQSAPSQPNGVNGHPAGGAPTPSPAPEPAAEPAPAPTPEPEPEDKKDDEPKEKGSFFKDLAGSIKNGVVESMSGADQVDPAITAAKEVSGMIVPLMKPLGSVFGKVFGIGRSKEEKDKKEKKVWFKRLWKELRELNKKPDGGGGGMLSLGGLGGLLMKIPGLSILGSLGSFLFGQLKTLLPRILGRALLPIAAMWSAVKSFNTSTEEYADRLGIQLNGSLIQELGVRFLGVLGDLGNTLTFGLAGKFGELLSPYIQPMFEAVGAAWQAGVDTFNAGWAGAISKWEAASNFVKDTWQGLIDTVSGWIKAFVDTKDVVKDVVKEKVTTTVDAVTEKGRSMWDSTKDFFGAGPKAKKAVLEKQMDASGMTDPKERAMFLGQMDHETGGFRSLEENLNYSADGLLKTFPTYYKNQADAERDAKNPEAIANKIYGGRNGNKDAGDGYKFRGRGFTQLTGRANYEEAGKALGLDLANNPDLAADPETAAKISTWFWKKNGLGEKAKAGDIEGVTKGINGGTNGLADRTAQFQKYSAAGTFTTPPIPAKAASASAAPALDKLMPPPVLPFKLPIGSNAQSAPRPDVMIPFQVGQNMGDRSIAHVATGGMASTMGN